MPPQSCDKALVCQTCLCCMCRCKNHLCFDQRAAQLPLWMQDRLYGMYPEMPKKEKGDAMHIKEALVSIPPNSIYERTTYKNDFCSERRFVDEFPLEQKQLVGSLRPMPGCTLKRSIYRKDFVPLGLEEQALCRAKLMNPLKTGLEKEGTEENDNALDYGKIGELRGYYCPPHCAGFKEEEAKQSCLQDHRERFNIGPPSQKGKTQFQKPDKPFEKFSSYKLDYKDYDLSPRKPLTKRADRPMLPPLSSDTSYREAFASPPVVDTTRPSRPGAKPTTLTVGDGPMVQQSTSMMDYQDHGVRTRMPFRPLKAQFQPPKHRMSGDTTTASSFPRWKQMPVQAESKKLKKEPYKPLRESVQPLLTTYQENFDGINAALCPGSLVVKAGPKVLQPRFSFKGSENGHDFFEFRDDDVDRSMVDCLH